MENTELSLSEARKLAKYYGNLVMKEYESVQTEAVRIENRECLSYCRYIILKNSRRKKIKSTEDKSVLEHSL